MKNKKLPENITSIHKYEEWLRFESIKSIKNDKSLSLHIATIENSMDTVNYFVREYKHQDDDQLVVQHPGIRLFNESASALKLLLSGYYQGSASIQRNLLEIVFLLDYFKTDGSLIQKWRKSDEATRKKDFKPVYIRIKLDERDGFKGQKRKQAYDLLCELAVHPTLTGFQMLRSSPDNDAHCGPFFESTSMKATLEELTKLTVQSAEAFLRFFIARNSSDHKTKSAFIKSTNQWSIHFYKKSYIPSSVQGLLPGSG